MTMHALPTDDDSPFQDGQNARHLSWVVDVADQILEESGLQPAEEIDDLVAIAYVGLLNSPPPSVISRGHLLELCRRDLVVWAWERGHQGFTLPIARD